MEVLKFAKQKHLLQFPWRKLLVIFLQLHFFFLPFFLLTWSTGQHIVLIVDCYFCYTVRPTTVAELMPATPFFQTSNFDFWQLCRIFSYKIPYLIWNSPLKSKQWTIRSVAVILRYFMFTQSNPFQKYFFNQGAVSKRQSCIHFLTNLMVQQFI